MREVPRPLAGAIAGLVGGVALVAVGAAARELLRVPTLPEALSEGATFFLPYALFEYMINTFRSYHYHVHHHGPMGCEDGV